MKTSLLTRSLRTAALAALLAGGLRAAEPATNTIKFSNPEKPGTLEIQIGRGNLQIRGSDRSDVVVKSDTPPLSKAQRKDGLRVLSTSSGFTLTEKDNVVTLESMGDVPHGGRSDFSIMVPASTHIVIQNALGGEMRIEDIAGDLEINAMNGEVRLERIGGGAVVSTMNGTIRASVAQLHENRPLSFTSMNGEVLLRVPPDARANVRLRTHNGSILTDFEDSALVTKVENTGRAPTTIHVRTLGQRNSSRSAVLPPEAQEAIREASRAAVEATRQAAQAIREAANAAREGADAARPPHVATPRPPTPPIPPVTGGKLVTGTLNGGGPEITVATMNGDVTLRKLER